LNHKSLPRERGLISEGNTNYKFKSNDHETKKLKGETDKDCDSILAIMFQPLTYHAAKVYLMRQAVRPPHILPKRMHHLNTCTVIYTDQKLANFSGQLSVVSSVLSSCVLANQSMNPLTFNLTTPLPPLSSGPSILYQSL